MSFQGKRFLLKCGFSSFVHPFWYSRKPKWIFYADKSVLNIFTIIRQGSSEPKKFFWVTKTRIGMIPHKTKALAKTPFQVLRRLDCVRPVKKVFEFIKNLRNSNLGWPQFYSREKQHDLVSFETSMSALLSLMKIEGNTAVDETEKQKSYIEKNSLVKKTCTRKIFVLRIDTQMKSWKGRLKEKGAIRHL